MKKLVLFIILMPLLSFSQVYVDSLNDNEVKFKQVYDVDLKKDEIKKLVNKWIAVNYQDANTVIKLDNEDNIILKGVFRISSDTGDNIILQILVDYTLDISYKENKYKLEFYDLKSYSKNMREYKSTVKDYAASFERYNENRPESSLEENKVNYENTYRYLESENSQIRLYLVNVAKTLNEYIDENIEADKW